MNPLLAPLLRQPLLTAAEEKALARRRDAGDRSAVNELVCRNQRLILNLAKKRYAAQGGDFDDLVSAGQLGLIRAAEKYDPDRQTRFSTYATRWIREFIASEFDEQQTPIHIPKHARHKKHSSASTSRCLASGKAIRAATFHSIDDTDAGFFHPWYEDKTATDPAFDMEQSRLKLLAMVSELKPAYREILTRIYSLDGGEPLSCAEIASSRGVSKQNILQIKHRAIQLLRKAAQDQAA